MAKVPDAQVEIFRTRASDGGSCTFVWLEVTTREDGATAERYCLRLVGIYAWCVFRRLADNR